MIMLDPYTAIVGVAALTDAQSDELDARLLFTAADDRSYCAAVSAYLIEVFGLARLAQMVAAADPHELERELIRAGRMTPGPTRGKETIH